MIFVTSIEECASCSNLPLEIRILRAQMPQLQTLVIGSGSSPDAFRPYLHQMGVDTAALIDEPRALLTALGVTAGTLVLVTDSDGRVLFVDSRRPPERAQYPIGRLLHGLSGVLAPSALPTMRSRIPHSPGDGEPQFNSNTR
jgi:hypothetical protein